jgi:dephospho-CoA kinase
MSIKVIGLTGGIGTGKSTAAKYLVSKGFAHVDADLIGHEITVKGSPMLPVLGSIFGPGGEHGDGSTEIIGEGGDLDRKALAGLVFSDPTRKAKLDEVMFAAIIEEVDAQIGEYRDKGDKKGILLDAPLLFESGLDSRCDLIMVMVADEDVRIKRVCARDGATEEEVRARIRNQLDDNTKIKQSQVVIDNSEGEEQLYERLDWFLEDFFN